MKMTRLQLITIAAFAYLKGTFAAFKGVVIMETSDELFSGCDCKKDWLYPDDGIYVKQRTNGRLVIRLGEPGDSEQLWSTDEKFEESEYYTRLQGDCNLIIREGMDKTGKIVWKSDTSVGSGGNKCFFGLTEDFSTVELWRGSPKNPKRLLFSEATGYISDPAPSPTDDPTDAPTVAPTGEDIEETDAPTSSPTISTTEAPTEADDPTTAPTEETTEAPTVAPTEAPTEADDPTDAPTEETTVAPTPSPTVSPTMEPTDGGGSVEVNWIFTDTPYSDIDVSVGDTIKFSWSGNHNLVIHPSGDCDDDEDAIQLAPTSDGGTFTYPVGSEDAGTTITFVCTVPFHCSTGNMLVNVNVSE